MITFSSCVKNRRIIISLSTCLKNFLTRNNEVNKWVKMWQKMSTFSSCVLKVSWTPCESRNFLTVSNCLKNRRVIISLQYVSRTFCDIPKIYPPKLYPAQWSSLGPPSIGRHRVQWIKILTKKSLLSDEPLIGLQPKLDRQLHGSLASERPRYQDCHFQGVNINYVIIILFV